ncbi:hypothetical protein H6G41_31530 [Tolypothrix sp. FACHB-123]|uniref:hypothetical protein n=1 Tax=Tolypothrix sp. FACHB-123 TaxID=2692868 RepID=UPI0016876402|nr:hypothetical protein [Tolypothrix sp. FACHB-123]MBD2359069.1 hypothetical protein [Tolypothrix sp. FACHB-123]
MLLIAAKALILNENLLNSVDLTLFKYINHICGMCPANMAEDFLDGALANAPCPIMY